MGNETAKGLSVNAKTLIIILLFVNVGFASKMLNKYYKMKEAGYIREKTFHEQVEHRVMKAFGSMDELNKMVSDITRQKEDAEKMAASFKEQGEQLKVVNKKIEDEKAKVEAEKARFQKEIWEVEDALSQAKKEISAKDTAIQELTDKLLTAEKKIQH
jgi:chromosome segregation ATPase